MSENNENKEITEPITDLSDADMQKVQKYAEAGMPGLAALTESEIARMMDLYLSGKTYYQISSIMRLEKSVVLYLSHKFDWFSLRREYLFELENNMRSRVIESKIASQDFLLQLTHLWQKKIGTKISQYLATGNEIHADDIDLKEVDKYLKTIEILHKISSDNPGRPSGDNKTPAIGLNLGDGVTITKKNDNEVEITPKQKTIGDVLKQFANLRRDEETKKSKSDIKKKEGEPSNEG